MTNPKNWYYGKRAVYTWAGEQDENGCIPSVVVEHERGHRPMTGDDTQMPWYWGKTGEECNEICNERNEELGYTREEVLDIISSSVKYNSPKDYIKNLRDKK